MNRKSSIAFLVVAWSFGFAARAAEPAVAPVSRHVTIADYLLPVLLLAVVGFVAWIVWKRVIHSPTRGLRRAVGRARRFNEERRDMVFPTPVPEMRTGDRVGLGNEPRATETSSELTDDDLAILTRDLVRQGESAVTDTIAEEALTRLTRLRNEPDEKNPVSDYFRLESFVRRYLMERYRVKAYGVSVSELLDALPHDLTSGVADYTGEILRLCALAQLRRFRPSRTELRRLYELTEAMILNDARQQPRGGSSNARS